MKGRISKKAKLLNKWNSYLFLILIQASVRKKHSKMVFSVCDYLSYRKRSKMIDLFFVEMLQQ